MTLLRRAGRLELNRSAQLERRMLDGRRFAVAPCVMVVEGVLNGELVPAEEFGRYPEAWNGRPVVVRHPQRDGEPISANSPEVWMSSTVGVVYNTTLQRDRLVAELWLDEEKISRLPGDARALLGRLDEGQPVEVSTGYFADLEQTTGTFAGASFDGIQRNLRPDHLALLPDEIGACSWRDGCGTPRTNAQAHADGVMVACFVPAPAASALVVYAAEAFVGEAAVVTAAGDLHLTLAYLGTVDEVGQVTTLEALVAALAPLAESMRPVEALLNGVARFAEEEEGAPVVALVDGSTLPDVRQTVVAEIEKLAPVRRDHGFLPHVTLGYAKPSGIVLLGPPNLAVVFDSVTVAWGDERVTLPLSGHVDEGDVMNDEENQVGTDGQAAGEAVAMAEAAVVEEPVSAAAPADSTLQVPSVLTELATAIGQMGGLAALLESLSALRANAAGQKEELVGKLATNCRCAFSKSDLQGLSVEQLLKLQRSLAPADYSGRAGAARAEPESDWVTYQRPA